VASRGEAPESITDTNERPIRFFMASGQVSDCTDAVAWLSSLPAADWLLAGRGCDADWFREALKDKKIKTCIPGGKPSYWRWHLDEVFVKINGEPHY